MADGDITTGLVAQLRVRLEDINSSSYQLEDSELYEYFKDAQLEIATLLHDDYLDEFTEISEGEDVSDGYIALTSIDSNGILRGGEGIVNVKVAPGGSNALWAIPIKPKDLKNIENTYMAESDTNILYYTFKGRVYILCTTLANTTADFYFLKTPSNPSDSVDPVLNKAFHNIMLDLAEWKGWLALNKSDRAKEARGYAYDQIKMLNAKKED